MKRKIISLLFVLLLMGCNVTVTTTTLTEITTSSADTNVNRKSLNRPTQPMTYLGTSISVVELLKSKDFASLSQYVHPTKGVRFSPFSHINLDKDLVFNSDDVALLFDNNKVYTWGEYSGSGAPIELTFVDYYNDFIYDLDFSNPNLIGNNIILGKGNMNNNIKEAYPNSQFVEFHFPGIDPEAQGMDWRSLRIVLEKLNNTWYVVGVVHDEWTI
ncbi:MAG: hypothetical protein K0Q49_1357 [Haloplasmataceae bacterium]|jgi:hypothetical protein|nr:hypothetical protein [Haloplasmataceae bacterium]